jgi:hypothetical protein
MCTCISRGSQVFYRWIESVDALEAAGAEEERKQVVMRKIVARMVQRILSHALTSGWFSLGQLNLN